jgi:hypothetical protein
MFHPKHWRTVLGTIPDRGPVSPRQKQRNSYLPPAGGADRGAPRTPTQSGEFGPSPCWPANFFFFFFCLSSLFSFSSPFLFSFSFFGFFVQIFEFLFKFENCSYF